MLLDASFASVAYLSYFSSANAKKWEVELATLKSNNARLTAALQESTANVEEWKRQLIPEALPLAWRYYFSMLPAQLPISLHLLN